VSRRWPDAAEQLEAYAVLLASEGVERGLIGPREVPRLWERHVMNCAVLADLIPHQTTLCDVGTGAGLPGMVLAVVRPDLQVTLLEPLLRRTKFLEETATALHLNNVEVVRGRAEEVQRSFDVVTARAVAPLDRLLRSSYHLVRPHGQLLAMKGDSAATEIDRARTLLGRLGAEAWDVVVVGTGWVDPPATVVRVTAGESKRGRRP
jgi:16S rRNA (guanine527-N7)-methyltransferase